MTTDKAVKPSVLNAELIAFASRVLYSVKFFAYKFHVSEGHGGVYLQATYDDPDIYTGFLETQATRRWLLSPHMSESELVQTAFKLCITSMEHRTREAFMYKNARIFGPHFDVNDLVTLCKERENAGGRIPQ